MTSSLAGAGVERFRTIVARRMGLAFDESKSVLLADVVRRRSNARHEPPAGYLDRLERQPTPEELTLLAQELTVGETYFFRHFDQFRAFADIALPDRGRIARAAGRPVEILSAGCASGEEPYSLAIMARDRSATPPCEVSIVGCDINTASLAKARRRRFSAWAVREAPQDVLRRHFHQEDRDFVLDEDAASAVRFETCNLAAGNADLLQADRYDVVFCRNVLMYFTAESAQALVLRIARALRAGGYLFLGSAETLRGLSGDFHLRHTHDTFYYQRKDERELARLDREPVADAIPADHCDVAAIVDGADTWVDAIRRAADRIERLAGRPADAGVADPPSPKPLVATGWDLGTALELLRRERFADALTLIEALPLESRRDADVLLLRGVLLAHSSQLGKAREACEGLLQIDELNAGAHYLLALCCEGAGDRERAAHHDQMAVYLDPTFAMPHLHLGLLARRSGDLPTARVELGRAAALLAREEPSRLLLFAGGFSRDALVELCRAELRACGAQP